jgi:hypothetical protein
MKSGASVVDRAELIKWRDALDKLFDMANAPDVALLAVVRECRHPDAQWLASLFPPGVAVSGKRMVEVLREQQHDARALFIIWTMEGWDSLQLLQRASDMGYAPAQAQMSTDPDQPDENRFSFAQKSALSGDRDGLFQLAHCYNNRIGCAQDTGKALELFKEAADLGHIEACYSYGRLAFGEQDWERFHWCLPAVARGLNFSRMSAEIRGLLPRFEKGKLGRVLHTIVPLLKASLDAEKAQVFGKKFNQDKFRDYVRTLELHAAMLGRARSAIHCWSAAALRCGVVKDVRVKIAKMAWEEVWRWGVCQGRGKLGRE